MTTINYTLIEKTEIIRRLETVHQDIFDWLLNHPQHKWTEGPQGKWTTGQQVKHLVQSISQLNKAMRIPKFILSWRIGKANRPVRPYDEIVKRYNERLAASPGVVAPAARGMEIPPVSKRKELINNLNKEKDQLVKALNKWSDKDLDTFILPHPLMGKMPIRELIMWTAYHTEHHFNQLRENY